MPGPPTTATTYEPVPGWAKIPHGFWLREATAVAVDSQDRVYGFNRGNMPMLVFDADGDMIDHWGNDTPHGDMDEIVDPYGVTRLVWRGVRFGWPHSVRVDPDDYLWLVDVHTHKLTKTDRAGTTVMTLGSGDPAPPQSGDPFNKPTDRAISQANGDIFVSDGYGNSRVHRYAADCVQHRRVDDDVAIGSRAATPVCSSMSALLRLTTPGPSVTDGVSLASTVSARLAGTPTWRCTDRRQRCPPLERNRAPVSSFSTVSHP